MRALILISFIQLYIGFCVSCEAENQISLKIMAENSNPKNGNKIKIKIGGKTFTATLAENPTASAFKALMPLTIKMNELNNNEKFAELPKSLPINPTVPANIQSGDLMMFGSKTLVLFYKGFSTSYSYIQIGKIDDVNGLVAALGASDVSVTFEY